MSDPAVSFVRLTEIPTDEVAALLNEPRNARHMPLVGEPFTRDAAVEWVAAKDAQWATNGYGPWAILLDGEFAGWGGFQAEPDGADLGLVLHPRFWGRGADIARRAIDAGFHELGLDAVLVSLPHSRRPAAVLARWGFVPDGEAVYDGIGFGRYRLSRDRWTSLGSDAAPADRG
ncbi:MULTISPECIES: GNAT family N-acetyltransferase [unclassified Agromyces]|uniref:GNAT family N-acetyltransferase n=1 Tax=unclassified Agromyces TaxID=2639701 RepID=UPI0030142B83